MLNVEKLNETYLRVFADTGIEHELYSYFEFEVPGAKYTPKYKAKVWDGKIRLYNARTKTLYVGLLNSLIEFAQDNGYTINIEPSLMVKTDITLDGIKEHVNALNLHGRGKKIDVREYQFDAIHNAIYNERVFLESPTASGKSAIIYSIMRWHLEHNRKCIIVVPTIVLVEQLYNDFADYSSANGWDVDAHCQKLYSGFTKVFSSDVLISTWQSIFRQPPEWLNQFEVLFGDECLHPDSLISMGDGNKKPISKIMVGDIVLTHNEETGDIESKPVLKVHRNLSSNEQMFQVKLNNGSSVKVTGNHKVFLMSGIWKRVDNLEIGDIIYSCEIEVKMVEKGLTVTGITPIHYVGDVYNLHVQDNHNYFANNVNVSNCHLFKAKSLVEMVEKMSKVPYRIGTSGTLDNKMVHSLVLTGLFGPIHKVTTSNQLMKDKHIAKLKIKCLVLKYNDEVSNMMKTADYRTEVKFITSNTRRNSFIANLAVSCKGNTLVLFNLIEGHGMPLHNLVLAKAGNRKVFFVYGKTPIEVREATRSLTANETDAIILASFGVFSTGINIPSIENIIFASPTKSKIRNLQSIGRGLRLDTNKEYCTLFDIADNMTWKKHVNFGMKHLEERCKIYAQEKFDFRITEIPI